MGVGELLEQANGWSRWVGGVVLTWALVGGECVLR